MSTNGLNKTIKVTEDAHEKLSLAKIEIYGAESARFSDVIETLAENEINRGSADE